MNGNADAALFKEEVIRDIQSDRKNWRLLMVPQFVFLFIVIVALALITLAGFYTSVSSLWDGGDIQTLEKAAKIFVTGSSSLLGFILIKLLNALRDSGARFITEEKFFTSQINMVRLAPSTEVLNEILKKHHGLE